MDTKLRSNPVIGLIWLFSEVGKAFWRKRAALNELADCGPSEWRAWCKISEFQFRIFACSPAGAKQRLICSIADWKRLVLTRPTSILR